MNQPSQLSDLPTDTLRTPHDSGERSPLPITHIPPSGVLPRRYVIHRHSQLCQNCGAEHRWSAVYAFNEMMSRTGSGKAVINLVPITDFGYNLPFEIVAIPSRPVPACHECTVIDMTGKPDPTATAEWQRIYHYAPAPEAKPKAWTNGNPKPKAPKAEKTLADLDKL